MAATEQDKLQVLVAHWIEHNAEHAAGFREWAQKAREADRSRVAEEIEAAAQKLDEANAALDVALRMLGPPA